MAIPRRQSRRRARVQGKRITSPGVAVPGPTRLQTWRFVARQRGWSVETIPPERTEVRSTTEVRTCS